MAVMERYYVDTRRLTYCSLDFGLWGFGGHEYLYAIPFEFLAAIEIDER